MVNPLSPPDMNKDTPSAAAVKHRAAPQPAFPPASQPASKPEPVSTPMPSPLLGAWHEWRGSGRVLVVEDDPAVRILVARALPKMGFTVSTAASGSEAVTLIGALPEDYVLVLMDVRLPGMAPNDLIREIRRHRPEIAIILMTGLMRETVSERLGGLPVNGFVHKPFRLDALAAEIRGVLAPSP